MWIFIWMEDIFFASLKGNHILVKHVNLSLQKNPACCDIYEYILEKNHTAVELPFRLKSCCFTSKYSLEGNHILVKCVYLHLHRSQIWGNICEHTLETSILGISVGQNLLMIHIFQNI